MCGIFGYLHKDAIPLTDLEKINPEILLKHRGPDDTGWLLQSEDKLINGKFEIPRTSANLFLLHKRLAILDLTKQASQPMVCANERYYLIFNGEIYNFLELKSDLLTKGIQFTSKSDSEVLLQSYIHWGKECLTQFVGMFAFAIFDRLQNKIFMARDGFGIKPFYYLNSADKFLFASEIKALLPFMSRRQVHPALLFHYLRSGTTDYSDQTLFTDIRQLPAGHYFEIDCRSLETQGPIAYWRPSFNTNHGISFNEAADKLQQLFFKTIDLHCRSDVAVAATLSGGIDSSSIVSTIRHLYPSIDIHTFSYIAEEDSINEEKWIDLVNAEVGAISHKVKSNPNALLNALEQLINIQGEPFGSSSIYAQLQVFQKAAELNVKVMLDGQGADEMLGGYTFYVAARFASLLKQKKFYSAVQLLKGALENGNNVLFRSLVYLLPSSWQLLLRQFSRKPFTPSWLNKKWFIDRGVACSPLKKFYDQKILYEELEHTLTTTSLPMLLRYADRNSMAVSIESRVPFLTPELVDFIFSLPEEYIISNRGHSKFIFRQAMKGIVPQPILDRRDKIGFATPEKNWLMKLRPWVEEVLSSSYTKNLPFFNHEHLILDWQRMLQNKVPFDFRYWRWINLIRWAELHQVDF